jgi:hypothetical protein
VREHEQQHPHREQVEVRNLEHAPVAARLAVALLRAEIVSDDRRRREVHAVEVEQRVREPEQDDVHSVQHDDRLEQAIAIQLARDHEPQARLRLLGGCVVSKQDLI